MMNKWLWYSLVVLAVVLLIFSMMTGKSMAAFIALGLALILKRYYHKLHLPKIYTKHKVYSNISRKIYGPAGLKKRQNKI